MAVRGSFFKAIVFISFILSIVPSVFPAECDNLLLFLNGDPYNQTEFLLPPGVKQRKFRCGCSDETQTVKWFFNNGTEVTPKAHKSQVYSKVRDPPKQGSNLQISKEAPPLRYVGAYRCTSDGSNASINIVVKDPSIEVTLSPMTTEVTVKDGTESLMLQCSITIVSGGTVEWTRNGANINNSSSQHTVETNDSSSSLHIKNLTKSDEGNYQCIYDISGAHFSSNQSVVSITGFIQVSIEPSDSVTVEASTEGRLNCVANGYQADMFMYQWRLNGVGINDATNKTLVISSVIESDEGMYECTVTNHWGDMITSNTTQLIITRNPPVITTDPMDMTVTLHHGNESATFSCEANRGNSDIQYRWFTKTTEGDMMVEGGTSNKLVLSTVTVEMNNTQYYCVASNNSGNVTSKSAHLIVTTFIQANIQLTSDTVEVGTMVTFECVAEGYKPETFKYQWRRDNNDITDSNNKTLILTSVTEDHSGSYECVVTNGWNVTATTPPAVLTVTSLNNPPVITTDPTNITISLRSGNENATFRCEANEGSSDIQYRWFTKTTEGDMMVEGGTSDELVLSMVTVEMNNTQYYCVASNNSGNVTSKSAHLTVTTFIQANIEPTGVTVEVGTMVTFECVAEGYQSETFKYQWRRDNNDITDSNNKTLILTSVTEDHSGSYECVVTNDWNVTATTPPAVLTVTSQNNPVITTDPEDITISLRSGNENATFRCEANEGSSDIQYRWFIKTTEGDMMVEGETSNELVLSPVTVEMNNTQYYCVASNNSGNVTSKSAHLTVTTFIQANIEPPGVTVEVGAMVTFECVAEGYQPETFKYQWRHDDNDITDSNNKTLILTSVTEDHSGSYECVVTNDWNVTATTPPAVLTVTINPPVIITHPKNVTVPLRYGNESTMFSCEVNGGSGNIQYRWFNKTTEGDVMLEGETSNVLMFSPVTVEMNNTQYYCVAINNGGKITSETGHLTINFAIGPPVIVVHPPEDLHFVVNSSSDKLTLNCTAEGEGVVYWQKDEVDIDGSEMSIVPDGNTLNIAPDEITDTSVGMYRCIASNIAGSVMSSSTKVTVTGDIQVTIEQSDLSAEVTTAVQLTCKADGYRSDMFSYQWRLNQEDIDGAINKTYTIPSVNETDRGVYQCAVTNYWNEEDTSYPVQLNVTRNLPVIIMGPQNFTVLITTDDPGRIEFSCVTEERADHKWITVVQGKQNTHKNPSNKTHPIFHINIKNLSRNGIQVYCEATNGSGTVRSQIATITILVPPPLITVHPEVLVNTSVGESVTFQCTAESFGRPEALQYYWLEIVDNQPIPIVNATTNTLQFIAVAKDDSTLYQCAATNENATVFSNTGRLNVLPSITVQPENFYVQHNVSVTLKCEAVGGNIINYKWIRNDTVVQNSSSYGDLTIESVQMSDEGVYQCEAMNERGETALSEEAEIIIYDKFLLNINVTDVEYYVLEGSDAYISCAVNIQPSPPGGINVTWYRGGTNDDLSSISQLVEINGTSYLILYLQNITKEEKGTYVCSVDDGNVEGGINISTNVVVEYPPTITKFPEVGPFRVGEPLHVFCSASGIPSPTVQLFINDKETFQGPLSVTHNVTSATIKDDHGTYKCVASSNSRATGQPFTAASKSIEVLVQGPPERIKRGKIKYNAINLTAINLTWAEPFDSNSPITHYIVLCDKCPTQLSDVDTNVTVIVGLIPGVEYKLNVAAVNGFGRGQDSVNINAQSATPESTAVTNLNVVAVNEVSVRVEWTNPQLYAPMIENYTIHAVSNDHVKTITVPAGQPDAMITNLVPTFSYNVSIVVIYNVASFMSDPTIHSVMLPECEACVEPEIVQPTNKNLTDLSFTLKWSPIDTELLQSYTLFYTSFMINQLPVAKRQSENPISLKLPANSTNYTVNNLIPFSTYCFSLQASYAQESVEFSNKQGDAICDIITPPLASSAPVNLRVENVDFTSVTVSWSPPSEKYGIIIKYKVYYSSEGVSRSQLTENADNLQYQITSLTPATPYNISVAAITFHPYGDDLEGPRSDTIDVSTSFAAPVVVSQPSTVGAPDLEQLTIVITVPTIDQSLGEMSHYLVVVVIGELPSEFSTPHDIPDNQLLPYDEATQKGYNYYVATGGQLANTSHILGNEENRIVGSMEYYNARLTADQQYSYFVRVYSKHNTSMYSTSELSSHFVLTSEDEKASSPLGIIIGAVAIVLVIIIISLIVLILFMIRIHSTNNATNKEAPLRDLPSPSKEHQPLSAAPGSERKLSVPFIGTQSIDIYTSVGPPTTLSIEVGGKPLPEVQWFKDDNPTVHRMLADGSLYIEKTSVSDAGTYTARVTNAAGKSEESIHVTVVEPSPPEDDPGHPPIRVEDFAQHVAFNRSNMEELFIEEYRDLEVEQTFSQHNARIPVNRNKNRYINIIPYDHSRVTLETDYQVTGSDYINASYVDGYSRPNEYIATQGPLGSTFGDFWKMIWEKRCTTIVMLTNLNEDDKIKCHQYWPSYGSATYDNFRVTLKSVETLAEYSIRVFTVEQINNGNHVLEVHQFHYTVWPDHGVPDCGTPLLSFHSRVEKFFKRGSAPMVIHCSAGVGRTGTFIVIDTQMQRIRDQSNIDIFNNVRRLRYSRNYMVQTQSQYSFLHDVMLEAIMCGDTSLGAPVQNIVDRLHDLAAVDPDTNETLFTKQFKVLDSDVLQEKKFTYTVATAPKNVARNRYQSHLAADQNFVFLPTTDDKPGYINASFVDGYRMRNAFIVTQGPMENTIEDFWEMIWEYKSHAIVMLTPLKENEKEQCCQYWPEEGTMDYGSFVVEAMRFYEPIGGEFKREFKLSHVSKPMESRVVTQFHYVNWPEDSCPDNGACIIDLIESVERVQRKTGNGPITVHCNNGVGRSGTYCALVSSLERFKAEQMADIFQTIKKMRMQRAGVVQTPEQYEFLHKALLEAIERFDTYSNFT